MWFPEEQHFECDTTVCISSQCVPHPGADASTGKWSDLEGDKTNPALPHTLSLSETRRSDQSLCGLGACGNRRSWSLSLRGGIRRWFPDDDQSAQCRARTTQ